MGAGGDASLAQPHDAFRPPRQALAPWRLSVFALNPYKTENDLSKVIVEHIDLKAKTQRRRDATPFPRITAQTTQRRFDGGMNRFSASGLEVKLRLGYPFNPGAAGVRAMHITHQTE